MNFLEKEQMLSEFYSSLATIATNVTWPIKEFSVEYAAGLFDGEGHFGINKHVRKDNNRAQYITRAQIANTERSIVEPFCVFGGKFDIVKEGRYSKNMSKIYKWTIHARLGQNFILSILPYLKHPLKIAAARTLLEMEFLRKKQGSGNIPDNNRIIQQERLYQKILFLNKRGPKSNEHNELREECTIFAKSSATDKIADVCLQSLLSVQNFKNDRLNLIKQSLLNEELK